MAESRSTIPVPPIREGDVVEGGRSEPFEARAYLAFMNGHVRPPFILAEGDLEIGRRAEAQLQIDEPSLSRTHAFLRRTAYGTFTVEDAGSVNGTLLNGRQVQRPTIVRDGDRLQFGSVLLKFVTHDEIEEKHQRALYEAAGIPFASEPPTSTRRPQPWTLDTWGTKAIAQEISYDDTSARDEAVKKLRRLPPLVTSWEVEELKSLVADAQDGKRFLLQGGDCAEMVHECEPDRIAAKLKILIQMSMVLIRSLKQPIIRVGRFAGQYAKPRSSATEERDGVVLPSYFGDLVNRSAFDAESRKPDPNHLVTGYLHAAATLNFVRALSAGGFADLRRPEYFDLSYFERADLSPELSNDYKNICREVSDSLNFARAFGDRIADDLMKVSFFTSHEGLNLFYEAAQTRQVPRRDQFYDLTTHLPWIGERTRSLEGGHVEFFRGIANPVAIKLGPKTRPEEAVDLCKILNPRNEAGKIVLIPRMGLQHVAERLPPLLMAMQRSRQRVLWVSDPMHGNATVTKSGVKTRNFDEILGELETTVDIHNSVGTYFGGVHFELTGDDVTECVGAGLTEEDLSHNYETVCDPRLNYRQALQMAFSLAHRLVPAPQSRRKP